MGSLPRAAILGTGHFVPSRVVTNDELIRTHALATTDEWIRTHVGVAERRWVEPGQATSDLATEAARRALASAGVGADALRRILLATSSGDFPTPATACVVQHRLGARCPAEDKVAACAGFLFGLDHAARLVATGTSPVLLIGADVKSAFLDKTDRVTCPIFGDGAGAVVVGAATEPDQGLLDVELFTDGEGAENLCVPAGGSRLPASAATVEANLHTTRMKNGRDVFQNAAMGMTLFSRAVLERQGLRAGDVDWVIAHQANRFILEKVAEALEIPLEKVAFNIEKYGNTVAATLPILLDEWSRAGKLRRGQLVLLLTAGAGYTGGAALYRW